MIIKLFLAGESDEIDTLYAACSLYAMKQSQLIQNAIVPEERDQALVRLGHIKSFLNQIDSLPANQQE
jgi:hypothetical protein